MMEHPVTEVFTPEEVVYLSPDASDPLMSLDKSKVYIIGGFVDESIKKVCSFPTLIYETGTEGNHIQCNPF